MCQQFIPRHFPCRSRCRGLGWGCCECLEQTKHDLWRILPCRLRREQGHRLAVPVAIQERMELVKKRAARRPRLQGWKHIDGCMSREEVREDALRSNLCRQIFKRPVA